MDHQTQLKTYLQKALAQGLTPAQIKKALLANHWPETLINDTFAQLNPPPDPDLTSLWDKPTWPLPQKTWARFLSPKSSPPKPPSQTLPLKKIISSQAVTKVIQKHRPKTKLAEKITRLKKQEAQLAIIQKRAFRFGLSLVVVIIFSLFWQFFVIK
jgi:hypothetical protein